jgi:hypothetical protein
MKSKIETPQAAAPVTLDETRLKLLEERLAKLDPPKPVSVIQPYEIGETVYSVADLEGDVPLTVVGYDGHRAGRVLIAGDGDVQPRSFPLASVHPLEKCRLAASRPSQIQDPVARAFFEGRNEARKPKPEPVPVQKQPRFM